MVLRVERHAYFDHEGLPPYRPRLHCNAAEFEFRYSSRPAKVIEYAEFGEIAMRGTSQDG